MKIAVSANGKTLDSGVDPRFGGSAGFVVVDAKTLETVYVDNSDQRGLSRNRGTGTAKKLIDAGADVLITGQIGPNAVTLLKRSGIEVYSCTGGTVQEAVSAFKQKTLKPFDESDISRGPGKMGGRGMGGGGRGRR